MKPNRPIHRTRRAQGPAIDYRMKWPILRLRELGAALAVLLAAAYGGMAYRHCTVFREVA